MVARDTTLVETAVLVSSFEEGLQKAQKPVLGFLIRITGSVHEAQDVLQSANVTAIEKREDFTIDTDLVAWLSQIAVNHYRNLIRRRLVSRSVEFDDERIFEVIEKRHRERVYHGQQLDNRHLLDNCLGRLPDYQKMLIEKFYISGMSLNELSQATGRKANAIGQTLHRARLALIDCVKKLEDEKINRNGMMNDQRDLERGKK